MAQETELKLELQNLSEYRQLCIALGDCLTALPQRNLYYEDAERRWQSARLGLRMRGVEGNWMLAVKGAARNAGGWTVRDEWERPVEPSELELLLVGEAALREAARQLMGEQFPALLADSLPQRLGELFNVREIYRLPGCGATVEMDAARLPNGDEFWEIEVESEDAQQREAAEAELAALLKTLGIAWLPSQISKRERFERALRTGHS